MKPTILVIDDSTTDLRLARQALEETNACLVETALDGEAGLRRLRREGCFAGAPRPALVVMDINMPKINGLEALTEIRTDPGLRNIPVVIMTTSGCEGDLMSAYDRQVNCFITKAFGFDEYQGQIRALRDFWLGTARLPSSVVLKS